MNEYEITVFSDDIIDAYVYRRHASTMAIAVRRFLDRWTLEHGETTPVTMTVRYVGPDVRASAPPGNETKDNK